MKKYPMLLLLIPTIAVGLPNQPCEITIISPSATFAFISDRCVTTHFCPHNKDCLTDITLTDAIPREVNPKVWQNLPYNANITIMDTDGSTQTFLGSLQQDDLYLTDDIFTNGFEEQDCE